MIASRVENSRKNIVYGLVGKIIQLFIKFILRTVLIYYLGAAYIGLDGLFLNVLSVLSVAELGISSAVCFALYRPLKDGNEYAVSAYVRFYHKVYILVGIVIFIVGILITPLLRYIVHFPEDIEINYYIIYYLFLLNTITTYFCGAYKQILFIADQKNYVNTNVTNVVFCGTALLQMAAIVFTRNYYLYLCIMISGNCVTNLYLSYKVTKKYPYLKKYKDAKLFLEERKTLKKNVYALAVTKISTVIYTSSDNIVISSLIGTLIVGYYSNYAYVISAVTGMIAIMFSSILASVGNAYVTETRETMYQIYKRASYVNVWIYGVCFTCFICLLQDFIKLWAGEEYLLSDSVVFVIVTMFITQGLHHTTTIFKDACGLFWKTRYRTLATGTINIISSIFLVRKFGLVGCFLGTILAYFLTTFLYDPNIVFREVFGKKNSKEFYVWYSKNMTLIFAVAGVFWQSSKLMLAATWGCFFVKTMLIFILVNIIYFLLLRRQKEFLYFLEIVKRSIRKKCG